ncbi:hypothetical protein LDENG_00099830 [Lucifuga dentata]|nr:hypothetical protein LDENG_00099830 [Lucifuga dentata]
MDEIFMEGMVYLQGIKFGKKTWKKIWMVLFKPSPSGIGRLELYTVNDSNSSPHQRNFAWQKKAPKKVVRLCDCLSITPATEESCPPGCTALHLSTVMSMYTLASTTCHNWLIALCHLAFQKHPGELDKGVFERGNGLTMEDNDLYSSWTTEPDQYHVTIQSTEASRRCQLFGEYLFSPDSKAALLLDTHTGDIILRWPYRLLRKFGQVEGGFSIEAGHRCDSGEGVFIFLSKQALQIFQAVAKQCRLQKKPKDSSVMPPRVRKSLTDSSNVQIPTISSLPTGPSVYMASDTEPEQVDLLYATINNSALNVKRSSFVSPHVTGSREAEGEENEGKDGWCQFLEAINPDNVREDCIYYNLKRSTPTRIKDQIEPEGDDSKSIYSYVSMLPFSHLQLEPSSSSSPQPLPQSFSSALPKPQYQDQPLDSQDLYKVQAQVMDKMKEVEEASSQSLCVPPTETPGSFKHRLAEILSKDLAKFQLPFPSGAGSTTFPHQD